MMKNKTRLLKKIISFFVFVIFTFNSFAAVVSDNDGSAFITKAEFDALKSNFQAQIDTYNTNIDNKIDDAISAYLSGISIAKQINVENLYGIYKVTGCTGGIAWNKSTTYVTSATEHQKIAWNLTLFGARSSGHASNKWASYQHFSSHTWENKLLTKNREVISFQKWEPRITGAGFASDFYHGYTAARDIPIYDDTNTFLFYDNLNLTKENRKNSQTVAGGYQQTSFYEATMYSVTYAEFTENTTDPYVITPYSTANERIMDSEEDYSLYDTTALAEIETDTDFTRGVRINCSGVAGAAWPHYYRTPPGYRMAATVGSTAQKRSDIVTKDFVVQCSGNGAMSSGLVLCIPQKKGKLYGQVKGSGTGTVLLWQGNKTSTYSASTKKTSFTIGTTYQDFEFNDLDEEEYVRLIFEPDSGTQSIDFKDLMLELVK